MKAKKVSLREKVKKVLIELVEERDCMADRLDIRYDKKLDGTFDGLALACDKLTNVLAEDK